METRRIPTNLKHKLLVELLRNHIHSHDTLLNEHFRYYFIDINTVPETGQRCIQEMWLEAGGGGDK